MAKILYKKKIYEFKKDCQDEFGKYDWYFRVYLCFSKELFSWQIETPNLSVNQKKLRDCMDIVLKDIEEDSPRYFRLKDRVINRGLHNKLW